MHVNFICVYTVYQRRQWHPTLLLLSGKSHGWRSLEGCSPWGYKESDMTEWLHFHFSLSCIGEGNGNPLQCSCLGNPRGRGACQAAIYGVAQSRTRLKRVSSSSSSPSLRAPWSWILHGLWTWAPQPSNPDSSYASDTFWIWAHIKGGEWLKQTL